jgi:DNA-binding Lrp family transcriptional regulator
LAVLNSALLTQVFYCNICPATDDATYAYVYVYSIFIEKCLYNNVLSGQLFKRLELEQLSLESSKLETRTAKKIGAMDIRILSLLQEDSRLSFNKIASKLGISVGTAFNHVKNLEKEGILKGYTVILDLTKLDYGYTALMLIQAEGEHLTDVENEIAKAANVVAVYDITGDYDAAVIAKFKDRSSLNAFIKDLITIPHIKRTVTNVALNVIKEDLGVKL